MGRASRRNILRFPGRSVRESWRFTAVVKVLCLIRDCLLNNVVVTNRDIYYRDVALFESQRKVNGIVDSVCRALDVDRVSLNVVAAAKGLVHGNLKLSTSAGDVVRISRRDGPVLIPSAHDLEFARICDEDVRFVLIVEKEAVFNELCNNIANAVLITGKGYPDIATRRLVSCLARSHPQTPFLAMVDSDPHGIRILGVYRFGSNRTPNQNSNLVCPELRHLGVSLLDYEQGWLDYAEHDYRTAFALLKKDWIHLPEMLPCRREIHRGIFLGKKAEMNVISNNASLSSYIHRKTN
jgi:meiotic recombination protein SPO11